MARYYWRSYGVGPKRRRGKYVLVIVVLAGLLFLGYRRFSRSNESEQAEYVAAEETATEVATKPMPEALPEAIAEIEFERAESPTGENLADSQISELVSKATEATNARPARIIEARTILNDVLLMPMGERQQKFVKSKLSALSEVWLFSNRIFPDDSLCGTYKVKSGDLLSRIGSEHKVPYEILMKINKIDNAMSLQAGQTIKIINGPFHARIYKSKFIMDLYLQNTYVRSFKIGLGMPGRETPTGLWVVKPGGKLIKPTWTNPDTGKKYEAEDPNYPLGSCWIGLEGVSGEALGRTGFALHGTHKPSEIGTASSRGCIRLFNSDVILIYNLLCEELSQVEIVD